MSDYQNIQDGEPFVKFFQIFFSDILGYNYRRLNINIKMEEPTVGKPSKKKARMRFKRAQKVLGGKPIFTIISVFVIVVLCILFSFSKETIERYQDAVLRKGQELFGLQGKDPCAQGWSLYEQDVVGLSFCYPSNWGSAYTEPKSPITRLSGLLDEYTTEGSEDRSSFTLRFKEKEDIVLRFFNEDYGGERYPNSYAEKYGFIDNIPKLKASGNICDYKMDFNHTWEYEGRINETYTQCTDGIKTAIVDDQEYFEKEVHSDRLQSFVYRRLQNGYFDHLLIIKTYGSTTQLDEKFDEMGALLSKIPVAEERFASEQSDFKIFIASINTFIPPKAPQREFLESEADDPHTYPIRKYFYLIEAGRLSEAYLLRTEEGRGDFEDFTGQYKDVYIAHPQDFRDEGNGVFYFRLDYEDHNEPVRKFGVRMTVVDGKLKVGKTEEFIGEPAAWGDYTAFAVERDGRMQLILKKGGEEKVIDEGDAHYQEDFSNLSDVKGFPQVKISQSGKYLIYAVSGYEWVTSYLYDIVAGKELGHFLGVTLDNGLQLTPDESFIYACRSAGFDGILPGEVYSLPSMDKVFDASQGNGAYTESKCRYDDSQRAVIFSLSASAGSEQDSSKEVRFDLE